MVYFLHLKVNHFFLNIFRITILLINVILFLIILWGLRVLRKIQKIFENTNI